MTVRHNRYNNEARWTERRENICGKVVSERTCSIQLGVTGFLFCVDMPDDVVGETDHFVACSFSHLGESFCLGLILERIAWEVDAYGIQLASEKVAL